MRKFLIIAAAVAALGLGIFGSATPTFAGAPGHNHGNWNGNGYGGNFAGTCGFYGACGALGFGGIYGGGLGYGTTYGCAYGGFSLGCGSGVYGGSLAYATPVITTTVVPYLGLIQTLANGDQVLCGSVQGCPIGNSYSVPSTYSYGQSIYGAYGGYATVAPAAYIPVPVPFYGGSFGGRYGGRGGENGGGNWCQTHTCH